MSTKHTSDTRLSNLEPSACSINRHVGMPADLACVHIHSPSPGTYQRRQSPPNVCTHPQGVLPLLSQLDLGTFLRSAPAALLVPLSFLPEEEEIAIEVAPGH
jgi:hypothetical protein